MSEKWINAFGTLWTKDYVPLIAAYGAVLSTIIFLYALRRERRRVVIKHTPVYGTSAGEKSSVMASFEVINKGLRPIVVTAPTLITPVGKKLVFTNDPGPDKFPKKLEEGEKAELHVSYDYIAGGLKHYGFRGVVTLRPSCADTTGKKYVGKKFKLDLEFDWTNH